MITAGKTGLLAGIGLSLSVAASPNAGSPDDNLNFKTFVAE